MTSWYNIDFIKPPVGEWVIVLVDKRADHWAKFLKQKLYFTRPGIRTHESDECCWTGMYRNLNNPISDVKYWTHLPKPPDLPLFGELNERA